MRLRHVDGARQLLLGGTPSTDDLVMFWNFIGRSHDDVERARAVARRHEDGHPVAIRPLSDYDTLFGIDPATFTPGTHDAQSGQSGQGGLEVVR